MQWIIFLLLFDIVISQNAINYFQLVATNIRCKNAYLVSKTKEDSLSECAQICLNQYPICQSFSFKYSNGRCWTCDDGVQFGNSNQFASTGSTDYFIYSGQPPTQDPTSFPSVSPTTPQPTLFPSVSPTTPQPTVFPTVSPTNKPSLSPSVSPTFHPTSFPTVSPTYFPTTSPTIGPENCPNSIWDQCGGDQDFTGINCCPCSSICNYQSEFYSQCIPAADPNCSNEAWDQCGGVNFNGNTCCPCGTYCRYDSEWYSQCIPGSAPTVPPSLEPTNSPSKSPISCDVITQVDLIFLINGTVSRPSATSEAKPESSGTECLGACECDNGGACLFERCHCLYPFFGTNCQFIKWPTSFVIHEN